MKIARTVIISLPERKEDRLIPLENHLKDVGWNDYEIFDATKLSDGKLGLIVSATHLLKKLISENIDCALILEDDMRFIVDSPKEIIDKCLEQAGEDFDLIYLGCNLWQTHIHKHADNLLKVDDVYGLHSVIYSKSGMKKVLKAINEMLVTIPLDVLIKDKVLCDGNSFCSFPTLTKQIESYSNIEKKIINWDKVLQERFNERTKHLV